jgi:hypothetical protein
MRTLGKRPFPVGHNQGANTSKLFGVFCQFRLLRSVDKQYVHMRTGKHFAGANYREQLATYWLRSILGHHDIEDVAITNYTYYKWPLLILCRLIVVIGKLIEIIGPDNRHRIIIGN